MNRLVKLTALAGLVALAACGRNGNETAGENVAQAYENQADQLENMAETTPNAMQEQTLENQADALRNEGERKGKAIDEADMNAAVANSVAGNAM